MKKTLPQEPEAYMPAIGEECECSYPIRWSNVFIVGKSQDGAMVIQMPSGECLPVGSHINFRPIKTEREKFIEFAMEATKNLNNDTPFDKILGALYEAGALKIPEGDNERD